MKKILMATIAALMMSAPVNAETTCQGGELVTVDDDTFCVSKVKLNWWSAQLWCQSLGLSLASIYDLCPDWDGRDGFDVSSSTPSCKRRIPVSGGADMWSSTAYRTSYACRASSGDSASCTGFRYDDKKHAACLVK